MAKKRKPRPLGKRVPGEKKAPGRHDRLASSLRDNLKKRKVQMHARRGPRGS